MSRINQALARAAALDRRRPAGGPAAGELHHWTPHRRAGSGALEDYGREETEPESAAVVSAPLIESDQAGALLVQRREPSKSRTHAWDEELSVDLERLRRRIDASTSHG